MKLPEDSVVCGLCREIIQYDDSQPFVESYEWGSLSGTPRYGVCYKTHTLNSAKEPTGKYAQRYA